ncbi:MAG: outer membrane protein assembly factor BamA [Candidatus Eisenbacteria bacterium]|nr:outer membrane protein assembly factor BamA [Candidatus Eisenbacteria bacterium]
MIGKSCCTRAPIRPDTPAPTADRFRRRRPAVRRAMDRRTPGLILIVLALAGIMVPRGAVFAQDASWPDGARVAEMEFRGLSGIDSVDVAARLSLEAGDPLTRDALARAVREAYGMQVFSMVDVEVETTPAGDARLIWSFSERPRVVSVAFQGYDHLGEPDLREKVTLRAGKLLDQRLIHQDRVALRAEYEEEGFPQAEVTADVVPREQGVAVTYRIEEGKRAKIRSIKFEGNEAFTDDDLRGEMKLKKKSLFRSGRFSQEKLEEDKQRIVQFYKNHGYKDAAVLDVETRFAKQNEDLHLTIAVDEGPLYVFGESEWTGSTVFENEDLEVIDLVRRGEPFSQEKLDETVGQAYSLYTEKGYLLGLYIDPEMTARGDTVDVVYNIQEGGPSRVHDIFIRGNTRTREYVIRRELELAPGDLLRRSRLLRSQRDVMALGFFEDVQVDYRPTNIGNDIDVIFNVKERSTGTASAGAGFSSDTGLTGFIDLGHNNLFGRGQSIQIHLERGGRRQNYSFSFTEPWLFGRPTTVGASVYRTERVLDLYTEQRRGGSLRAGRPWFFDWPDYTRVFLGYRIEELDFADIEDLSDADQEYLTSGEGILSQVSLTATRSSTDKPFYPTLGSVTRWQTEFTGGPFGGDLHYIKSTLELRQYFVPFWKPTVMLRYKAGHLMGITGNPRIPGNEPFRLGGTTFEHLRGYDDFYVIPEENITRDNRGLLRRLRGGKFMFTFTAEYQFPLVAPLHGLLFFDAGNTWKGAYDFSLADLRKSVGVGLRLEIPMLGMVGLDWAYNLEDDAPDNSRTHLILGPAF